MRFKKIKTGNPLVIQPFDPNSVNDSTLSDDVFSLSSPAFSHGDEMPRKFGWKNGNISPPLVISGIPAAAKSLALIMDDPDAMGAVGKVWVHWVEWNIRLDGPDYLNQINSAGSGSRDERNADARSGMTDFGEVGYGGPAPPDKMHTYVFKLYALDSKLVLPDKSTKADVEKAMEGHIIEQTQLTGTYAP